MNATVGTAAFAAALNVLLDVEQDVVPLFHQAGAVVRSPLEVIFRIRNIGERHKGHVGRNVGSDGTTTGFHYDFLRFLGDDEIDEGLAVFRIGPALTSAMPSGAIAVPSFG